MKNIQEEINKEYMKFEKKVKPLREKLSEKNKKNLLKILSKHKGIIYKKNYGKDYCILTILNSINNKNRLKYFQIIIEKKEESHISYIKERKTISKKEALDLIKEALIDSKRGKK